MSQTTVADLIAKLQELPPDWHAVGTKSGSVYVQSTDGQYGYVFPDGRPTRLYKSRVRV